MVKNNRIGFEISVSGRDDGTLEAAYIRFRHGEVARTEEILQDVLLADYNQDNELIGFEILAPVELSKLASRVDESMRQPFTKFVRSSAPRELVTA